MRLLLRCRQNHWLLPADLGLGSVSSSKAANNSVFRIYGSFRMVGWLQVSQRLVLLQSYSSWGPFSLCTKDRISMSVNKPENLASCQKDQGHLPFSSFFAGTDGCAVNNPLLIHESGSLKVECQKMGASLRHPTSTSLGTIFTWNKPASIYSLKVDLW